MRASECPPSNCSISSLMLAALSSCLVAGFLLSMAVTLLMVAVLLMVFSPLRLLLSLPLLFMPCSRHVPTCRTPRGERGGSKCKERGITHPWSRSEAGAERAKGCTSGARKPGETSCAREGAAPP